MIAPCGVALPPAMLAFPWRRAAHGSGCIPQQSFRRIKQDIEEAEGTNRWCIFTRKMMRFWRTCWIYAYRQIVDKRIGARRAVAWDEPEAPAVAGPGAWDDYNKDDEWGPDDYNEDDDYAPDTAEYWGDYVWTDLMDANDV